MSRTIKCKKCGDTFTTLNLTSYCEVCTTMKTIVQDFLTPFVPKETNKPTHKPKEKYGK
ncbi:hypothetical protein [Candidatus Pelagibacter sp. Uisw_130]|jgi:hypothetical protein|uniref:hypothetical protein n=1 Tax=Candidatus Pelagibacter sp. Uisw_130 TaxID=3230989 RepID=UPI0039EC55A8|tara:strand:+ start:140 stop:316 length:177 start_codon:yes stop_codon:yes gene_type:complete